MQTPPDGFNIPLPFLNQSFHIYYYGILIMLGVVAAAFLAQAEAKRRGLNTDIVWDALFWVVLAGIVGARIWHILTPPPSMVAQGITTKWYLLHPLDMINIRNGGLGIPGAIIGGAIALWIYCRRNKLSFLTWTDVVVPGVALAQAIGRWGNYFNQELYGYPTNLPWGIYIDPVHRLPGYEIYTDFHPLFFYEFLWDLIGCVLLLLVGRRWQRHLLNGDIFFLYIIYYSVGRFYLEGLKIGVWTIDGIPAARWITGTAFVASIFIIIYRHLQQLPTPPSQN
jgi:phosphatidylglycerol---prolipoprotein diacylglyceryl transferase